MSPAPSQRQLRVGEIVRHALSEILQRGEIDDADLDGAVVTVSEVRMTPDLKRATAYLMPLGGQGLETVLAALKRNRKRLRHEVARRVDLRFAPDIHVVADTSFAEGDRIDALLRSPQVRRDLGPPDDAGDEET